MQNHAAARLLPRASLPFWTLVVLAVTAACSVRSLDATGVADNSGPTRTSIQPAPPTSGLSSAPAEEDDDGLEVGRSDERDRPGLSAGTCFDQSTLDLAADPVPCGQAHRIEVYAVEELPDPATIEIAVEMCDRSFAFVTGYGAGLATVMERLVLAPDEQARADGDTTGVCYVVYPEPVDVPLASIDPLRAFGSVSLFGLRAGDCLVEFGQAEVVFDLVDCDAPHAAEVFAVDNITDAELPDIAPLDERVDDTCFGAGFEEFVGVSYDRSTIVAYGHRPSAETWQAGDRLIACILTDGLIHTTSFAGSGR